MAPNKPTKDGIVKVYRCHAEVDALKVARPGDVLEVLRWTKSGDRKISKPCPQCMEFIRKIGIRKVYYHDRNGSIVRENVRRL